MISGPENLPRLPRVRPAPAQPHSLTNPPAPRRLPRAILLLTGSRMTARYSLKVRAEPLGGRRAGSLDWRSRWTAGAQGRRAGRCPA